MKVLHVVTSMDPTLGGVCQAVRNMIPDLDKAGCTSEVVCLDDPNADFFSRDGFPVHAIGQSRGPWAYHPDLKTWLEKELSNYQSVIIHGLWQYQSHAVTKLVRRLRRKSPGETIPRVFVMPHGMLDPWFQTAPSRRIKAWRNWIYWKWSERYTISEADSLLFTCNQELQLARKPFRPYRPKKESSVGMGVAAPPDFSDSMKSAFEAACPAVRKHKYLLFLSRIHPKKGIDLLLRSYSNLAKLQHESGPLPTLVIAGPLDSPYAKAMQKLAEELNLMPAGSESDSASVANVSFPGMLSGDAKWGAFYGCDAFVLPSHQENFGIAVVEALACSKPVLISDQVNIFEEVSEAGAGLVDADNLTGTTSLLQRWLKMSTSERVAMEKHAFTCYHRHFTPQSASKRLLSCIR